MGLVLSALLLASLPQPALGQYPPPPVAPTPPAAPTFPATGEAMFDPLLRDVTLFLGPDGALLPQAPAEGRVPAPQSVPVAQAQAAPWLADMPAGAVRGGATLNVTVDLKLPGLAVPPTDVLFTAVLRRGADVVDAQSSGPSLALPGPMELSFAFRADGAAFQAGEGLVVELTYQSPSASAAPAVEYVVGGANGSALRFTYRYAGLDALGHRHAPGDQHFLLDSHAMRRGDLGGGLWGVDLGLAPGRAAVLDVPADARLLLVQLYLAPDLADPPASLDLDLPGGATTVYRGEVLVREVPLRDGAAVRCTSCGAGSAEVATFRAQSAAPQQGGEPIGRTTASRDPAQPVGPADDAQLYILAVAVPALLMLGGVMLYAMRKEIQSDEHHARSGRAPPAPRREPQREPQGARLHSR